MGKTVLTKPLTDEQIKKQKQIEKDWDMFTILLNWLYEAYCAGEIESVDRLAMQASYAYENFTGDSMPGIPEYGADRLIGNLILKAIKHRQPNIKLTGKIPESMKMHLARMVKIAHANGYSLSSSIENGKETAYDHVANRMKKLGYQVSARTMKESYQKYKKT